MLASVDDAEDAVQDALVRAWRGLPRFENRSSVRTWLFAIATNTALDTARRRARRRELPLEHGPVAGPGELPGAPLFETLWLEPYPDVLGGVADGPALPEASYERRESIELAFVVALQRLSGRQRAVLILRDVLAFSAGEVAAILDTSVPAVNSALQRARASATGLPDRSQQATLSALGDERISYLAQRYGQAIETGDMEMLLSMLTEDATWSMPPLPAWYRGRAAIAEFLRRDVFPERWRHRTTRANGQLAVGGYVYDAERRCYVATALDVLTLDGDRIAHVTGFLTSEGFGTSGSENYRFSGAEGFGRFGLPGELPV